MSDQISSGDIVEIETEGGRVCVQVTHRHPTSSEVVRVLPGLDHDGSGNLDALAAQEPRFVAMVPLSSAIESGRLAARRIGSAAIPEAARAFPIFRMAIRDKKEGVRGDVAYWWFWDGEGLTYDAQPGPEAERFPLREVLSIEDFLSRLR